MWQRLTCAPLRSRASGAALHQQVALELGQNRQDTHHHLSGRGARVDVVHQRHELRALALDLLDDLKEVKLQPGEAIQAVDVRCRFAPDAFSRKMSRSSTLALVNASS